MRPGSTGLMVASQAMPRAAERVPVRTVEPLAGALVALGVLVLLAGVLARYFMDQPPTWTDELASTLFL